MGTVFTYPTVFLATAPAVSSSLNAKGRDSLHEVHVHDRVRAQRMALARNSRHCPAFENSPRAPKRHPFIDTLADGARPPASHTAERFSMVEKSVASTVHACKHRCERNPKVGKRTAPPRHPLADILANGTIHAKELHALLFRFSLNSREATPSEPVSTNMRPAAGPSRRPGSTGRRWQRVPRKSISRNSLCYL